MHNSYTGRAYNNEICKECIKKNRAKYGEMSIQCSGITVEDDVKFAIKNGASEEESRFLFDPVYFFESIYQSKVRWYQKRILYCSAKRLAGRQCRQTGKSLIYLYKLLHQVITTPDTSVLIVAPTEKQIAELWNKYIYKHFIHKSQMIAASVVSSVKSPMYEIVFSSGGRITLSIANDSIRGWSGNILYIDEAAIIPTEALNSIIMTIGSAGSEAQIYETSTPKGRGNQFHTACNDSPEFNEFHVSIDEVEEMKDAKEGFKRLLGETGYLQECCAEFPDVSGGPFNYRGIDLARQSYEYEDCIKEPGYLYFIGCDWNGPNVGTYFYVVGFNPDTGNIKAVDKKVVSSAVWNSTVAKQTFIELNRKWAPKVCMADIGYGHAQIEDLKLWSLKSEQEGNIPHNHPDAMIKYILEPVQFGGWVDIDDPFTREPIKKTTRGFMVSQISKLFEPQFDNTYVPISFPASDKDLQESLENYKLINTTSKGTEQYGFEKGSGIEDHLSDAFNLALYGIIKNYSELFKKIIAESVPLYRDEVFPVPIDDTTIKILNNQSIILLTDNSSETIALDSKCSSKWEPVNQEDLLPIISRTFDKGLNKQFASNNSLRRKNIIKRTSF